MNWWAFGSGLTALLTLTMLAITCAAMFYIETVKPTVNRNVISEDGIKLAESAVGITLSISAILTGYYIYYTYYFITYPPPGPRWGQNLNYIDRFAPGGRGGYNY
jgi:hypothetical protein